MRIVPLAGTQDCERLFKHILMDDIPDLTLIQWTVIINYKISLAAGPRCKLLVLRWNSNYVSDSLIISTGLFIPSYLHFKRRPTLRFFRLSAMCSSAGCPLQSVTPTTAPPRWLSAVTASTSTGSPVPLLSCGPVRASPISLSQFLLTC